MRRNWPEYGEFSQIKYVAEVTGIGLTSSTSPHSIRPVSSTSRTQPGLLSIKASSFSYINVRISNSFFFLSFIPHSCLDLSSALLSGGFNTEQPWLSSTSRTDRPYTVRGCGGSDRNPVIRHILYLGELTIFQSVPPHSISGRTHHNAVTSAT